MISLRRSITQDAQARESLHASMAAYLTTLDKLQRYAPPFQESFVESFRQNLRNIASALEAQADPAMLRQSASLVGEQLKSLWESSRGVLSRWTDDCRSLAKVLSDAARSMEAKDQTCNSIFQRFSERVEMIAASSDMEEIRRGVRAELTVLKSSIDEMMHEGSSVVAKMQEAVVHTEARFQQVHTMAFEDQLTGLPNRRQAEAFMRDKIRSGEIFCVVLLDVNQFKRVNDGFGHACGDAVLKFIANSMKAAVGSKGMVARWAGDEFLVILHGDLIEALNVHTAISANWGPQRIEFGGESCELLVSASSGICQYIRGETAEALLARADVEMYREKGSRQNVGGIR